MIAIWPAWYAVCETILPKASALVFVPNSLNCKVNTRQKNPAVKLKISRLKTGESFADSDLERILAEK